VGVDLSQYAGNMKKNGIVKTSVDNKVDEHHDDDDDNVESELNTTTRSGRAIKRTKKFEHEQETLRSENTTKRARLSSSTNEHQQHNNDDNHKSESSTCKGAVKVRDAPLDMSVQLTVNSLADAQLTFFSALPPIQKWHYIASRWRNTTGVRVSVDVRFIIIISIYISPKLHRQSKQITHGWYTCMAWDRQHRRHHRALYAV
jgi:hypothetical protein